jgi:hypothetical protein
VHGDASDLLILAAPSLARHEFTTSHDLINMHTSNCGTYVLSRNRSLPASFEEMIPFEDTKLSESLHNPTPNNTTAKRNQSTLSSTISTAQFNSKQLHT